MAAAAVLAAETRLAKSQLRSRIRQQLRSLSPLQLTSQSRSVFRQVLQLPEWNKATRIGIFLPKNDQEVDTMSLVTAAFQADKRCFVPKCISDTQMLMLEAFSVQDIASFPRNRWNIPEPEDNYWLDDTDGDEERHYIVRAEALDCGLDLLFVPGAAFDAQGRRLGYGRGYYDRYIGRLRAEAPGPKLVGLCFPQQLLGASEQVPTEAHDLSMDLVIAGHSSQD